VLCLTPLACQLMGLAGADSSGHANNGAHIFCGGLLLLIGGLLEFLIGNTFSFVVFCTYGGFFLALGATSMPVFNATTPYLSDDGSIHPDFYRAFGFFHLFTGIVSLLFFFCSIWINIVLVILFAAYTVAFTLLAVADWVRSSGNAAAMRPLEITAGVACSIVSLCGWYALIGCLLNEVKVPMALPMGDLSGRGGNNRARRASVATREDA